MTKKIIKIGNKLIGQNQPVFVVAEAGVNHNQRLDLALKLIDVAALCRADAVKFQTARPEQVVTAAGEMADYQKRNLGITGSQLDMIKKLVLPEEWYPKLIKRSKEKKIIFLSTPHGGFESVDFLQKLNVPAFKFGAGDLTNLPVLQYAARFKKPMILSTGMATFSEVKEAVNCIKRAGNNKIIVLHCTTNYPCPLEDVNLRAMQTMIQKLDLLAGCSDHTLGTLVPIMAVTLGACLIEKHFTLDRNMAGPDHKASVNPTELEKIVKAIRNTEKTLGERIKRPTKGEEKLKKIVRKSIVANLDIKKGDKFTVNNLAIKRPGTGLEPKYFFRLLGKKAKADIRADELIRRRHYE